MMRAKLEGRYEQGHVRQWIKSKICLSVACTFPLKKKIRRANVSEQILRVMLTIVAPLRIRNGGLGSGALVRDCSGEERMLDRLLFALVLSPATAVMAD